MDVQFKNNSVIGNIIGEVHIYQVSTFDHISFCADEYSKVYIQ